MDPPPPPVKRGRGRPPKKKPLPTTPQAPGQAPIEPAKPITVDATPKSTAQGTPQSAKRSESADTAAGTPVPPVKRKRGRPPKKAVVYVEKSDDSEGQEEEPASSPEKEFSVEPSTTEPSTPVPVKRGRGRPRKNPLGPPLPPKQKRTPKEPKTASTPVEGRPARATRVGRPSNVSYVEPDSSMDEDLSEDQIEEVGGRFSEKSASENERNDTPPKKRRRMSSKFKSKDTVGSSDDDSVQEEEEVPAPVPVPETPQQVVPFKRKRGRPSKADVAAAAAAAAALANSTTPTTVTPKQSTLQTPSSAVTPSGTEQPVKRGRGRPRKSESAVVEKIKPTQEAQSSPKLSDDSIASTVAQGPVLQPPKRTTPRNPVTNYVFYERTEIGNVIAPVVPEKQVEPPKPALGDDGIPKVYAAGTLPGPENLQGATEGVNGIEQPPSPPKKRGPGRPRKHPRPEDLKPAPTATTTATAVTQKQTESPFMMVEIKKDLALPPQDGQGPHVPIPAQHYLVVIFPTIFSEQIHGLANYNPGSRLRLRPCAQYRGEDLEGKRERAIISAPAYFRLNKIFRCMDQIFAENESLDGKDTMSDKSLTRILHLIERQAWDYIYLTKTAKPSVFHLYPIVEALAYFLEGDNDQIWVTHMRSDRVLALMNVLCEMFLDLFSRLAQNDIFPIRQILLVSPVTPFRNLNVIMGMLTETTEHWAEAYEPKMKRCGEKLRVLSRARNINLRSWASDGIAPVPDPFTEIIDPMTGGMEYEDANLQGAEEEYLRIVGGEDEIGGEWGERLEANAPSADGGEKNEDVAVEVVQTKVDVA